MKWAARRNRDAKPDASLPDTSAPHRARKNTRKWCRGKEGTEHVQELRYRHEVLDRRDYPVVIPGGRRGQISPSTRPLCGWFCFWRVERRVDGRWSVPDRWHWSCSHEIGCSVCGKRLAYVYGPDCPEYRPITEADKAQAKPRKL